MDYLQIFTDFRATIEPLDDAERGRLFSAMLDYAHDCTEQNLTGNERFIWPTAKLYIDRSRKAYENRVNGAAKARARKADTSMVALDTKSNQLDNNLISRQDKDNDKDNDKDKDNSLKEKKEEKKADEISAWIDDANRIFGRRTG